MQATESRIQQVLEGNKQYKVPLFQRPYSWEREQWNALWTDILTICEEKNPRTHFMGSIVTVSEKSVAVGVSKFLLIDGQQRLTTIYLLLAALRDKAVEFEDNFSAEINETLLTNKFHKGDDFCKLLPTKGDRESFVRIIKNESPAEDDKISKAFHFFIKKMKLMSKEEIEKIKQVVTDYLVLVNITLDKDDNSYLVFESLNYKGKALEQSDLIRNFIFMKIHINQQDNYYNQYWMPMERSLGNRLTDFIRHYLMKDGSQVKINEVYLTLKERNDSSQEDVTIYLADLNQYSIFYTKLLWPENEENTKIANGLKILNKLEVATAYPFLLNIYSDFSQGRITDIIFSQILEVLENYMIRRFVCGVPTQSLGRNFQSLYKSITTEDIIEGIKKGLKEKNYPNDHEFMERLETSKLYTSSDSQAKTKLILEKLESSFQHKEIVNLKELSIEHILPQKPSDKWKQDLGENWDTTKNLYLHTIGNLTLSGYNSSLSNKDFLEKKKYYKESKLELNKYFDDISSWNEENFIKRAKNLAKIACQVWPYFGFKESVFINKSNKVTGTTPAAVIICGQRFTVSTWREVAQQTLESIFDMDDEQFGQLLEEFPHFVNRDSNALRIHRPIKNKVYMETHLSASAIHRYCMQVTSFAGLTGDSWQVEIN